MAIIATEPTVKPAIDAKTFDRWALQKFESNGTGNYSPVKASCILRKAKDNGDGTWDELPNEELTIEIDDLYATAATIPEVATALGAILAAVLAVAVSKGLPVSSS